MKYFFKRLSGLAMTAISGAFLAASLLLALSKKNVLIDPAWAAVIISGLPIAWAAIKELFLELHISSELLITIAMAASIAIGELFAAGEIAFIMAIGTILEAKTIKRAQKGLKNLINLAPAQGRIINGGRDIIIPVEQINAGDILRVLPGEAIPVDGEIIIGGSSVDQSLITGESLPVDKSIGDSVYCGTINHFGAIDIRAEKVGEDSSLQKLIHMVRESEKNKAPVQRVVDKWATWLVPVAFIIAITTYLVTQDITRAVTVLVVFCPCALALATPTSIMAAIGQAAKNGVIIKSGDVLERMGKVDTITFDKTGTLTYGSLTVSDIISFDESMPQAELLALAASVEARSEHPLGKAIVDHSRGKGLHLRSADNFTMTPGGGVSALIDGRVIMCGSNAWLSTSGVLISDHVESELMKLRVQGKAVIIVSDCSAALGVVAMSDTLRPSARDMVSGLRAVSTDAVLLTGDHKQTSDYIAGQAGITEVYAELLPEQKTEKIQELQELGRTVCMIGDGVNDAPALKTADVGVAMGTIGSDIAVEAADIALMGDDISKIPYLKRLSNATVKLIKLNITLSMLINLAAIVLSVLALLNPVTGALVHNAGSVLVVLNAALLYDRKYSRPGQAGIHGV